MADTTVVVDESAFADASAPEGDERLAHRGPIRRLLTRPEIGALLGTAAVWILFWLVAAPFSTVGGTANFLDVAAITGMMAVPVALLMIGGEFDLSSGAMTGATAIVVMLLSKEIGEFGGAGLTLHVAVPLSLAFALAIGWFNGTVVERTSLPSFIVTLGTFFVLIGGKLGFAKLFTDKVIVEGLDESDGYTFWDNIFGAEWIRNGHVWDGRDWAWAGLLVFGGVALLLGTFELTYGRRSERSLSGALLALAGTATAVGGFALLLTQDGSDWLYGLLLAAGALVGAGGWCRWRYEPLVEVHGDLDAEVGRDVGIGLAALLLSVIVAAVMDASDSGELGYLEGSAGRWVFFVGIGVIGVLALLAATGRLGAGFPVIGLLITGLPALSFLVTVQATRALLFAGLAVAGFVKLISAAGRARQTSTRLGLAISTLVSLAMVALAFFIQSEGDSRKIRIQLFTSLLLVTLAYSAGALASFLSSRRTTDEPHPELGAWTRVGGVVAVVGALVFAVIELADGGGVVFSFSTGLAKGALLGFGIYAVGTLYRLLFTRDGGIGRALVSVGTGSLMLALAAKMLFVTTVELDTIPGVTRFRVSVLFYLLFAAGGAWLLARTQFGSWTYAVGGNKDASRSVGVPAARTKTTLFMMTSAAAWVTGMVIAFRLNSVQADVGDGNEFRYIIVAVVGGNLLTGGYGSALGAAFGALIFGMITQGIGFAGWNTDWRFLVLGALLLIAVIVNNFVRQLAERSR